MDIANLDYRIKVAINSSGVEDLYPPQADVVDQGLLGPDDMLAFLSTSAGKSLLGEIAMLDAVVHKKKAIYICPLRALASEKYNVWSKNYSSLGFFVTPVDEKEPRKRKNVEEVSYIDIALSSGDYGSADDFLGDKDIIVSTTEKLSSLIRSGAGWLKEVGVLVIDEIHLLGSPGRGATLEMLMMQFKCINPGLKIVGLSATVGNCDEIAGWMQSKMVYSDWRPVKLREGIYKDGRINFDGRSITVKPVSGVPSIDVTADSVLNGHQCLVFNQSRNKAVEFARNSKDFLRKCLVPEELIALRGLHDDILEAGKSTLNEELAKDVLYGVAFHHAGLSSKVRKLIEQGFRDKLIKVISCTPTLSAGLNLPARRVIVTSLKRYNPHHKDDEDGWELIPVGEYKQIVGRAGRKGLDVIGEGVIIPDRDLPVSFIRDSYINGASEVVRSQLGSEPVLRFHILSIIHGWFANSELDIDTFLRQSFLTYQDSNIDFRPIIRSCLDFLKEYDLVEDDDGLLSTTSMGQLVCCWYIDPLSYVTFVKGVEAVENNGKELSPIRLLQIICTCPNMRNLYLRDGESAYLHELKFRDSSIIDLDDNEWTLSSLKTAFLMRDLSNGIAHNKLYKAYTINEGDLQSLKEVIVWLLAVFGRVSDELGFGCSSLLHELYSRVYYEATPELLPFLKIKGVGKVRAEKLVAAGYSDIESLRAAPWENLKELVGKEVAGTIQETLGIKNEVEKFQVQDESTKVDCTVIQWTGKLKV